MTEQMLQRLKATLVLSCLTLMLSDLAREANVLCLATRAMILEGQ